MYFSVVNATNSITNLGPRTIPYWTYVNALEMEDKTKSIRLEIDPAGLKASVQNGAKVVKATHQLNPIADFLCKVEVRCFSHTVTTYRSVLHNDMLFKELYDISNRPVSYIENGMTSTKSELTGPCMICGVVLPVTAMQVDHQAAKGAKGGGDEALLRAFRAMGLTKAAAHGPKNSTILTRMDATAPAPAVSTQPGRALPAGSRNDRYTLNDKGAVLYSIIKFANRDDNVRTRCLHGLTNLRLSCPHCNTSRGDQLKYVH